MYEAAFFNVNEYGQQTFPHGAYVTSKQLWFVHLICFAQYPSTERSLWCDTYEDVRKRKWGICQLV